MKFELSKKDKDSFLALNDVLNHNIDCTVLINNYMEYGYTQITADDVERLMLTGLSTKDAFITLLAYPGIDTFGGHPLSIKVA